LKVDDCSIASAVPADRNDEPQLGKRLNLQMKQQGSAYWRRAGAGAGAQLLVAV